MGGVGKTTVAIALCHDHDIRAAFPDGILWTTLGQHPDLLAVLSGWLQELGDYAFRPTAVESAAAHLRRVLQDKAVLLVIDDAWELPHARHLAVGGAKCCVLITTRDASIVKNLGFPLCHVGVMMREQSLALLAGRLGRPILAGEKAQANDVARAVGDLPLALELAASQVVDGVPWTELLEDLTAEVARLEALVRPEAAEQTEEVDRKRLSLLASLHISLRRLNEQYRHDFAWMGVLPEDAHLAVQRYGARFCCR
jgi:hypothetical protein